MLGAKGGREVFECETFRVTSKDRFAGRLVRWSRRSGESLEPHWRPPLPLASLKLSLFSIQSCILTKHAQQQIDNHYD